MRVKSSSYTHTHTRNYLVGRMGNGRRLKMGDVYNALRNTNDVGIYGV